MSGDFLWLEQLAIRALEASKDDTDALDSDELRNLWRHCTPETVITLCKFWNSKHPMILTPSKSRIATWYDTNEPDSLDERGPHD